MVTELLQKYIWLVQTFIRAGEKGLTLSEISDKWESRFDSDYSRRTFNNHREAVEEVFGIRIECNRSSNRYFIRYTDDVSDDNAESAWLINTFTVNNMLALGKERLSGRVSVEDIPSGHIFLTAVMEAMTEGNEIVIGYQKYTSSQTDSYTLRPYAVKEFAKRWYIVAYCIERDSLRVYGLDRVMSLEITGNDFQLGLTRTTGTDTTALTGKACAHSGKSGKQVLVLGKLYLESALSGFGSLGKNIQDQGAPIQNSDTHNIFQGANIRR